MSLKEINFKMKILIAYLITFSLDVVEMVI